MTSQELLTQSIIPGEPGTISHLFDAIANTSSKLEKEELLKTGPTELVNLILKDTYDLSRKYRIRQYEVSGVGEWTIDNNYESFHYWVDQLALMRGVGKAQRVATDVFLSKFDRPSQIILARILDRNLRIGIGNTAAENTGSVKKFPVRLANSYKDVMNRVDIFDGSWLVSRKLDGCRCLAFVHATDDGVWVEFRSRQNKVFTTLDNLVDDYKKAFANYPGDYVVDGEVCIVDEDGNESFKGLMSEITRKNHTIANPKHIVYDFLTQDEFWGKEPSPNFANRLGYLSVIADAAGPHIQMLEQQILEDVNMLTELQKKVKELGWEGLMVAKNVPYQGKRTNDILKLKDFCDGEYVVTGVIEGDHARNTPTGTQMVRTVAALTIEHKGNVVKVGTGLTQAQRDEWYEHPENIIGKTIGIRYFEETVDKKTGLISLRFPTLYWVYGDGREV